MTTTALVVLTARGPDRLLQDGGSQAWRLNQANAKRVRYCVCVQNRNDGPWGGADQPHHTAFMVGRIKDVLPSPERPERFIVVFSEYAVISKPDAWPGLRNPVRYGSLDEFGIENPDALPWRPMPSPKPKAGGAVAEAPGQDEEREGFGPLTVAEAKAGLALGLGVPETAIEIVVHY